MDKSRFPPGVISKDSSREIGRPHIPFAFGPTQQSNSEDVLLLMNEINLGETFYILARERGMERAEYFLGTILPSLRIERVSNRFEDVIGAARIKAQYPLSFADCFAVTTALKEKAHIVTGDPEFKRVEKIAQIEWM